ncbi:MAG TPA: tripartite tricarboxylate transporter TctB family protein [Noviherbaspirillum sp.]|uniref:tripartite tricarboxylate transporter TctB family protein n=1 Tax=Noviherbaspirillum sp. TaxID=1926288 RepID=UPI002B47BD15|nr:tripartite tricarboxylate transporter TctB family protein [Noviherbaspirillum sp.]HJV85985.1 tripartite tricarboxylate transporter TctB family protein [Noviherbaspirillum sp.]
MSDRILGLVALLMAGAMTIAAWGYAAPVEYEPVGPRAFPLVLALLMALCGAWLMARPGTEALAGTRFARGRQLSRIMLCAGSVVAYAVLFQAFGFIIATALMGVPVGRFFGGTWRQCALTGIGLGIALYVLFDRLLDVVLPLGLLKPLAAQWGM